MTYYRHGGNRRHLSLRAGIPIDDIVDFSANLNPLGPPEWYRPLVSSHLRETVHYPDPDCFSLLKAASARYGVTTDEIIAGNGSTELLYLLPRALQAARAVIPVPAYVDYAAAAEIAGLAVEKVFMKEESRFSLDVPALEARLRDGDMTFIGHPNNPTGLLCEGTALRSLALRNPAVTFVVDEAFADFVEGMDSLTTLRPPNVVVLYSLTKIFAIPGLRLGLAFGDPGVIARMKAMILPWSVNALAQAVGEAALQDDEYTERTRQFVRSERQALINDLATIAGLTVYPGRANFLLLRLDARLMNARRLADALLDRGIAVRVCDNFDGLDSRFFRVAVRTQAENARLCDALRAVIGVKKANLAKGVRKSTPAVMFQGTGSNVGKSVLAAAFCRILLQDGFSVAPFKSQNMSLNSFVTREGGEMGRAQVFQAQACRIEPDVRMNPVLLKPNTDTGSQVIVLGKPEGNMDVAAYVRYKPLAFAAAQDAYDSLCREHDVIVLEGAGSPAEVNLKHHDIVNMEMARFARSPVLIVGDIDRGGVFASFVGTMEVLAEWERDLVAGFVINRFRGDEKLLADAIDYTKRHTGRPTFGVVPYLHNLGLPEEDSVTFKSVIRGGKTTEDGVEIALVDLSHISNFTDFDSLRMEPDVNLRVIRSSPDMGTPDAVIIPGSKNVIGDMDYLHQTGIAQRVIELAGKGKTEIVGICGGLQILGGGIDDPHGIESRGRNVKGLRLLPITTILERDKTLACVGARHVESRCVLKGYEIHHGKTVGDGLIPAVIREDGEVVGVRSPDGLVWGTYLHGIFDADEFRRWFIDRLRARRGLSPVGKILLCYDLEPAFERLAGVVRRSLRIADIYRLMGLK